jgi:hypothetical protein
MPLGVPFEYLKVTQIYTETDDDGVTTTTTLKYENTGGNYSTYKDGAVNTEVNPLVAGADNALFVVYITATFTEPLCTLSPFLFSDLNWSNKAGFLGLNSLNLTLNIDTDCRRVFRNSCYGNTDVVYKVSLGTETNASEGFQNTKMLLNFLSIPPTELVPTKNVLPMMNYVRYLSSSNEAAKITAGSDTDINSPTYQLSLLPKKFILVVRKPMTSMNSTDSDSFLTIKSISINMANNSGILSNSSQQELWRMSIRNGSTQSFNEFSGKASNALLQTYNTLDPQVIYSNSVTNTIGSILVLDPAYDLSLGNPEITDGSIGQFSLQFKIRVQNNYSTDVQPEICLICANNGLITTQSGSSSLQQGLLTKELVIQTIAKGKSVDSGSIAHSLTGAGVDEISGGFSSMSAMSGGSLNKKKSNNIKKYF